MRIIGIDEVGMGPLAGPIVAAAVLIDDKIVAGVRDSKLVEEELRYELADKIRAAAHWTAIAERHAESINATRVSTCWREIIVELARAAHQKFPDAEILMDGAFNPKVHAKVPFLKFVVHGDDNIYQIAAASLVAKAYHDRFMLRMHEHHPQYLWSRNKGYGTTDHMEALKKHGLTSFHRKAQVAKAMAAGAKRKKPMTREEEVAEYGHGIAVGYAQTILAYEYLSDYERRFTTNMKLKLDAGEELSGRMKYFLKQFAEKVEKRRRKTQKQEPNA